MPGPSFLLPFIKSPKDCLGSGETRFSVSFPRERFSIEKNGHEERISQRTFLVLTSHFRRKGLEDFIENGDWVIKEKAEVSPRAESSSRVLRFS